MEKNTFEQPRLETEDLESLSRKLFLANQELQKLQTQRSEMLANISHDLRAPITAIRSAVDLLLSGHSLSPEDTKAAIYTIDRRTATLENLIQDMYLLFSVEDTSRSFQLSTLEAAPFFEEYFYDTILDSRYEQHEMLLEIPDNLNCIIEIDIQKIIRVLDNLFSNAANYTQPGSSICLQVKKLPDQKLLSVSVIDNGPGIPQEALTHIFDRTYTVSDSRTPNSHTGSGLGLSIAKAIVERHGGIITCESDSKKGCNFTFTLPCRVSK
ncbi:MAG: HAMP domain-containing histidine kinase [Acetatifactor sp.]|jgi:signal transduction histidine kinase|nr:HAMP domain-containing histidine kinase [Acetatifactor sp.]